jgi:hypothetical protein
MMTQLLLTLAPPVAVACGLLLYYAGGRRKRSKSPPLPRSEKVSVELLLVSPSSSPGLRTSSNSNNKKGENCIVTLHVHLPSDQFLANMKRAVMKERNSLKELWDSSEQEVFRRVWDEDFSYYRRYSFIRALLEELEANIDAYSDSDKLSEYLCPHLYGMHKLLSRVGATTTATDEGGDGEGDNHGNGMSSLISQVVHDSTDKNNAFNSISAVVLNATKGLNDDDDVSSVDSGRSRIRLDLDLSMRTELLLFTLKQLCMVMFVKHFLSRYVLSSEPPANTYLIRLYRLLDRHRYVCGLLVFIAIFVLDTSGLLSKVVPNYESMFLRKDPI